MAYSLNEVRLLGNLGRDPEMRYTASGQAVTQFTVATSRSWRPEGSDEWQEETEWSRIVVWGRVAEQAAERLHKGSKVLVLGRLQTRSWDDAKTGLKRYVTEIVAERLVFIEKNGDGTSAANRQVDQYVDAQVGAGFSGARDDTPPTRSIPTTSVTVDGADFDDLPF